MPSPLAEAAGKPIVLDHDTAKFTYDRIGGPTGGALSFKPLRDGIVAAGPDLLD